MRLPLSTLALASALAAPPAAQTALTTVRIAGGLDTPVFLTAAPGDDSRLFVLEQNFGRVRVIRDGQLLSQPFLDIGTKSSFGGEQGLLGIAFHPSYQGNGFFYLNYTDLGGDTIIERYRVSANPDRADATSGAVVLTIPQPYGNHNGGCIAFGPDGYLYIGMGDGGSQGDPNCLAQRGDSLLGKMLRIDVSNGLPYSIPPSNPFVGNANVRDEIWSIGWRNPWRFSFDRTTGDLYVGDVGQDSREEVSFQPGTSRGGENYGWKIREGNQCYSSGACPNGVPACSSPVLVDPIHSYSLTNGNCSVVGGYVYRGCAVPDLVGTYFFADYCSGRIWSMRYDGQVRNLTDRTAELRPATGGIGSISSFGQDNCGELYVIGYGGSIYKIVAAGPPTGEDLGFGKTGSNGRVPTFDACGRLNVGGSARLRLREAPPSRPAALLAGFSMNPTTFLGGTIVPLPAAGVFPLSIGGAGAVEFELRGAPGPASFYAQFVMIDLGLPQGLGFSNALRINVPP